MSGTILLCTIICIKYIVKYHIYNPYVISSKNSMVYSINTLYSINLHLEREKKNLAKKTVDHLLKLLFSLK